MAELVAPSFTKEQDQAFAKEQENILLQQTIYKRPAPLVEIAERLVKLTWGEMKDFAEGISGDPDKIWAWATGKKDDTRSKSKSPA